MKKISNSLQPPTTGIGSLQSDISRLKNELRRHDVLARLESYEISTLIREVSRLASVVDGLLTRLQEVERKTAPQ